MYGATHIDKYAKFTLPTMSLDQPFDSKPKRSGVVFIGLNVLRLLSLVTLVLVVASQFVALVDDIKAVKADKAGLNADPSDPNDSIDVYDCDYFQFSAVPTQAGGEFWSVLNRIFIVCQCLVLLISEVSLPVRFVKKAYETYLPVVSDLHGLGFLGIWQIFVAVNIVSRYVKTFEQISAWMLVIMGGFNGIAGILLRVSAKERRLIFSWGNLASLTPQTQAAHAVLTGVNEKLHHFKDNKPVDNASQVGPPMYKPTPDDRHPEQHHGQGKKPTGPRSPEMVSGNTTLVNNTPMQFSRELAPGGDHGNYTSDARSYVEPEPRGPARSERGTPPPRRSDEIGPARSKDTGSDRRAPSPTKSYDSHSASRYYVRSERSPPPPATSAGSRQARDNEEGRGSEDRHYQPGQQHGGFSFGKIREQREGPSVSRPPTSMTRHGSSRV